MHSALRSFDLSDLSPAHQAQVRRVFALGGIRGGATDDDALDLDALLARVDAIADLSDEDVETLNGDLRAAAELILEDASDEAIERSDRVFAAMDSVATAQTERAAEAARIEGEIAERRERLERMGNPEAAEADAPAAEAPGPDDESDDGDAADGEPAETEHTEEHTTERETETERTTETAEAPPERIAASGVVSRVAARRPAATRPRNTPAQTHPAMVLRASANVPGMPAGQPLDTPERVMAAFDSAISASRGARGDGVRIPVMTLGAMDPSSMWGDERTLTHNDIENERKIAALTSPQALRASGGICAPVPIQYDLPILGSDARPVRDALLRFGADRGGVRLLPPPTLDDMDGSVGIWSNANDLDPGSDGDETKPCLRLDCPADVQTLVDAITRCLTIGNFRARYFPEQIQAWTAKVGQLMARTAEIKNLTKIGALSTQTTGTVTTPVLGTTRSVLREIGVLAAGMRSRRRLDRNFPLRLIGPQWLMDNMIEDLAAETPGATDERLATAESKIATFFGARNINVTWSMDGEAGFGQIFGAQGNGALRDWPARVILYLFVEGTWLHLDGGTLDLGLVRDSSLNATNDFQLFSEIFENVAFHGEESFRLVLEICANGATAAPVDTGDLCDAAS